MLKAVLDSNVLISGAIAHSGTTYQVLAAWQRGDFQLLVSEAIIADVVSVLSRPFFREHRHVTDQDLVDIERLLRSDAVLVEPKVSLRVVTVDPDDDRILECALAGGADTVVSGDHHLLDLGIYDRLRIITAREFLALLPVRPN